MTELLSTVMEMPDNYFVIGGFLIPVTCTTISLLAGIVAVVVKVALISSELWEEPSVVATEVAQYELLKYTILTVGVVTVSIIDSRGRLSR